MFPLCSLQLILNPWGAITLLRQTSVRAFALLVVLGQAGCFLDVSYARPRISEVEVTSQKGGQTKRSRYTYAYNREGEIQEIELTEDGEFVKRTEYKYADGRIVEISTTFAEGDPVEYELDYKNGLLAKATGRKGELGRSFDIEFFNDDAFQFHEIVGTLEVRKDPQGNLIENDIEVAASYDDEGRVDELKSLVRTRSNAPGGQPITVEKRIEYRYDDDGRLSRQTFFEKDRNGNTSTSRTDYEYNDDGRVVEASGDGIDIEVTYDKEGRIVEVEAIGNGTRGVLELSYEEGSTKGFVVTSFFSDFIDLYGKPHTYFHPESDSFLVFFSE